MDVKGQEENKKLWSPYIFLVFFHNYNDTNECLVHVSSILSVLCIIRSKKSVVGLVVKLKNSKISCYYPYF